ncbi:MAG: TonB-dependent receptor [Pseudomonadota bacterium]
MSKDNNTNHPHTSSGITSRGLFQHLLVGSAMVAALTAVASAQETEVEGDEITVTGSRIQNSNLDSPAPVTVIDGDFLLNRTSRISIGDELAELPQFGPLSTRAASVSPTGGDSATGVNLLDLRNIGATRTLVLVNGRRHVAAAQNASQPDVNTIPAALIERVEVLTGGASSVYGADALAGVVNFIMKEDFEGIEFNAQGGMSEQGDAATYTANLTMGRNFANDRGNIAVNIEYANSEELDYQDRDFSRNQTTLQIPNPEDGDFALPPGENDGIPDFITADDLRLAQFSEGGVFTDFASTFLEFQPDGSLQPLDLGEGLIPNTGPRTNGGGGLNTIEGETLVPSLERLSFNVITHYDINEYARLFFEGKIVSADSDVASTAPARSVFVGFDNPFLDSGAAATLQGLQPGAPGFVLNRYAPEFGRRGVENERLTSRAVIGLKGDIEDRWSYEVSYGYGRTDTDSNYSGNIIEQRVGLSADAVTDVSGVLGTPGAVVCRAQLDAGTLNTGNPDIDDCVAGNFFGEGSISDEVVDYVNVNTTAEGLTTQHVLNGFVTTNTAGLIDLPGGAIDFVLGAEYRRDATEFEPDERDLVGDTLNAGIQPVEGEIEVIEGFTEMVAPILAGMPYADTLEVSASARVAHYDLDGVGTNVSWGVGTVYAPVSDVRLRGSYQRAVRAPNISELFSPVTPSTFFTLDPCSFIGIAQGSEQRNTNCQALGAPDGGLFIFPPSIAPGVTGGNPDLDVERGSTWTVGALFTPRFIPGFTLSVDYYDIEIEDAIFQPNPSTVLTLCVDGPSIDNPFCDAVTRDPNTAEITNINLLFDNVSKVTARGIDFDAQYALDLAEKGNLSFRMAANYVLERDDFLNQLAPDFPTQELKTVGTPQFRFNLNSSYSLDRFSIAHTVRYNSSQYRTDPANVESVGGQPPANPDIFGSDVIETGNQFIHDIVVNYQLTDEARLFVGVDNLNEPDLPPGIYGGGFGGANYDAIGRFVYGGVNLSF